MLAEQVSDESPGAALLLTDLVCRLRDATRSAKQFFEKSTCGLVGHAAQSCGDAHRAMIPADRKSLIRPRSGGCGFRDMQAQHARLNCGGIVLCDVEGLRFVRNGAI